MLELTLTRRNLIAAATTLGPALVAGRPAAAAEALWKGDEPGWDSFRIGEMDAIVISDGPLAQGDPTGVLKGYTPDELRSVLRENFLSETQMTLDQNILLLIAGARKVLFDTGTGGAPLFGDKPGKLMANMSAAGIDPASITDVILSHAHPDHIWGMSGEDGTQNFPNAQVHIHETDYAFFADPANDSHPLLGAFMPACRAELEAIKDRLNMVKDGQEVLPGITAMFAPGHTPGHTIFGIQSGSETVIFAGDLAHHHAVFARYPDVQFAFDTDAAQMVETRKRYFDMLATDRSKFLAYHFPFPGLGNLAKASEGYRWIPAALDTI